MKNLNNQILADTCAWIGFFKMDTEIGNILEMFIREDSVWTCGIILFELLQGIRSDNEKKKILNAILMLNYTEMSPNLWLKSGELSALLKKKGCSIPLSDILIAVIAIENNLQILTMDKHFEQIPGVMIYKIG